METTIKKPSPKLAIIISLIAILITSGVVVASLLHQQNKQHQQQVAQCQTQVEKYTSQVNELTKLDPKTESAAYTLTQCETNPEATIKLVEKAADQITQTITTKKIEAAAKAKLEKEAKEKAEAEAKAKKETEAKTQAESKTQPATQSAPPAAPTRNNTPAAKPAAPAPKPAPAANTAPVNKPTPTSQPAPAPAAPEPQPQPVPQPTPTPGSTPDGGRWVETTTYENWECKGTTDGKPFDCRIVDTRPAP